MRGPCAAQAGDHSPEISVSLRSRQKNKFGMAVVATLHLGRKSSEVCSGLAWPCLCNPAASSGLSPCTFTPILTRAPFPQPRLRKQQAPPLIQSKAPPLEARELWKCVCIVTFCAVNSSTLGCQS